MSDSQKTITIAAKGDGKGLDPISKALKGLINDLERFQKLVNQTNLSGNNKGGKPDSPFLNKVIAEESALKKLSGTMKDTSTIIDRVLNRSMDSQAKQVENLTNKINQLNAAAAKTGQGGRGGGNNNNIGPSPSNSNQGGGSGGGNGGGGGSNNQGPIPRGAIPQAIRNAGAGAALLSILGALPGAYLNSLNAPYQNRVAGASGFGGTLRREALAGDVSSFFELVGSGEKDLVTKSSPGVSRSNSITAGLGTSMLAGPIAGAGLMAWLGAGSTPQVNNSNLSNIEYAREASTGVGGFNAVKGVLGGGIGAATMGATHKLGVTGGIGDIGSNVSVLTPEGLNSIGSQAALERLQQQKQIDVKYQPFVEDIQQMASSRLNAYRLYGGRSAYQSVMGMGRANQMTDEGEIQALQAHLSGLQGNDRGFNLFNAASRAPMTLGIGRSSAASLLSGLTTGSGGDTSNAEQKLEDIFKKAIKEGISDSNLAEDIAEATADASLKSVTGVGGRFTGSEDMLLMALRGGPQDKAAIALNQSVNQGLDSVMGSKSGFESVVRDRTFASIAKGMGIKNLGMGDIRTISSEPISALNSMSDADIEFMKSHGINVDQMLELKRNTAKQTILGLASSTQVHGLSAALNSNSPEDANKLIQQNGLGYWLSSVTNTPNNPEARKQVLQTLLGNNFSPADVNLGPDRASGTQENALVSAQSNIKGQFFNQEITDSTFKGQFDAATQAMQQFAIITKDFNNEEFRNASGNIHAVAEAITELDKAAQQFLKDNNVLTQVHTK